MYVPGIRMQLLLSITLGQPAQFKFPVTKTRNPGLFRAGIFFVWRKKRKRVLFAAGLYIGNIFEIACVIMHT
jgi:hypothetical protein